MLGKLFKCIFDYYFLDFYENDEIIKFDNIKNYCGYGDD